MERKGSSSSIQTQCCQHSQNPAGSRNYLVFGWPSPLILAATYLAPNWAWIHRSKWAGSIWETDCAVAHPQFTCLVSCTYLCSMYVDPLNEDSHVCSVWMKYTTVISNRLNCRFMIHSLSWRDLSMLWASAPLITQAWHSGEYDQIHTCRTTVKAKLHKKFILFKIIWGSKITNWGLNLVLAPGGKS